MEQYKREFIAFLQSAGVLTSSLDQFSYVL